MVLSSHASPNPPHQTLSKRLKIQMKIKNPNRKQHKTGNSKLCNRYKISLAKDTIYLTFSRMTCSGISWNKKPFQFQTPTKLSRMFHVFQLRSYVTNKSMMITKRKRGQRSKLQKNSILLLIFANRKWMNGHKTSQKKQIQLQTSHPREINGLSY